MSKTLNRGYGNINRTSDGKFAKAKPQLHLSQKIGEKFRAWEDAFHKENGLNIMQPLGSKRAEIVEKEMSKLIDMSRFKSNWLMRIIDIPPGDDDTMIARTLLKENAKIQLHKLQEQAEAKVQLSFIGDFILWLQGKAHDKYHDRTPWGRSKPALTFPDVREYITGFLDVFYDTWLQLTLLSFRTPRNLNESFIYFKFLLHPEDWPTEDPFYFIDIRKFFNEDSMLGEMGPHPKQPYSDEPFFKNLDDAANLQNLHLIDDVTDPVNKTFIQDCKRHCGELKAELKQIDGEIIQLVRAGNYDEIGMKVARQEEINKQLINLTNQMRDLQVAQVETAKRTAQSTEELLELKEQEMAIAEQEREEKKKLKQKLKDEKLQREITKLTEKEKKEVLKQQEKQKQREIQRQKEELAEKRSAERKLAKEQRQERRHIEQIGELYKISSKQTEFAKNAKQQFDEMMAKKKISGEKRSELESKFREFMEKGVANLSPEALREREEQTKKFQEEMKYQRESLRKITDTLMTLDINKVKLGEKKESLKNEERKKQELLASQATTPQEMIKIAEDLQAIKTAMETINATNLDMKKQQTEAQRQQQEAQQSLVQLEGQITSSREETERVLNDLVAVTKGNFEQLFTAKEESRKRKEVSAELKKEREARLERKREAKAKEREAERAKLEEVAETTALTLKNTQGAVDNQQKIFKKIEEVGGDVTSLKNMSDDIGKAIVGFSEEAQAAATQTVNTLAQINYTLLEHERETGANQTALTTQFDSFKNSNMEYQKAILNSVQEASLRNKMTADQMQTIGKMEEEVLGEMKQLLMQSNPETVVGAYKMLNNTLAEMSAVVKDIPASLVENKQLLETIKINHELMQQDMTKAEFNSAERNASLQERIKQLSANYDSHKEVLDKVNNGVEAMKNAQDTTTTQIRSTFAAIQASIENMRTTKTEMTDSDKEAIGKMTGAALAALQTKMMETFSKSQTSDETEAKFTQIVQALDRVLYTVGSLHPKPGFALQEATDLLTEFQTAGNTSFRKTIEENQEHTKKLMEKLKDSIVQELGESNKKMTTEISSWINQTFSQTNVRNQELSAEAKLNQEKLTNKLSELSSKTKTLKTMLDNIPSDIKNVMAKELDTNQKAVETQLVRYAENFDRVTNLVTSVTNANKLEIGRVLSELDTFKEFNKTLLQQAQAGKELSTVVIEDIAARVAVHVEGKLENKKSIVTEDSDGETEASPEDLDVFEPAGLATIPPETQKPKAKVKEIDVGELSVGERAREKARNLPVDEDQPILQLTAEPWEDMLSKGLAAKLEEQKESPQQIEAKVQEAKQTVTAIKEILIPNSKSQSIDEVAEDTADMLERYTDDYFKAIGFYQDIKKERRKKGMDVDETPQERQKHKQAKKEALREVAKYAATTLYEKAMMEEEFRDNLYKSLGQKEAGNESDLFILIYSRIQKDTNLKNTFTAVYNKAMSEKGAPQTTTKTKTKRGEREEKTPPMSMAAARAKEEGTPQVMVSRETGHKGQQMAAAQERNFRLKMEETKKLRTARRYASGKLRKEQTKANLGRAGKQRRFVTEVQ